MKSDEEYVNGKRNKCSFNNHQSLRYQVCTCRFRIVSAPALTTLQNSVAPGAMAILAGLYCGCTTAMKLTETSKLGRLLSMALPVPPVARF